MTLGVPQIVQSNFVSITSTVYGNTVELSLPSPVTIGNQLLMFVVARLFGFPLSRVWQPTCQPVGYLGFGSSHRKQWQCYPSYGPDYFSNKPRFSVASES